METRRGGGAAAAFAARLRAAASWGVARKLSCCARGSLFSRPAHELPLSVEMDVAGASVSETQPSGRAAAIVILVGAGCKAGDGNGDEAAGTRPGGVRKKALIRRDRLFLRPVRSPSLPTGSASICCFKEESVWLLAFETCNVGAGEGRRVDPRFGR